ncbi:HAD family hydrolase [Deinococcus cellulosilyticus]|uniref:FCP1 homology domain-containing protein n=1 Tax=Deinococcus cellulosilyticus (strain DSM 18568 / NBRC 106333 / KACC 11606 / 5516J-15) TaxID=1223518 RepID=A0A511MZL9_DEIC1|nr:HAD family hydrolase [Deinococcus cellulosilyticus]GEM45992.1 hypothetical protein DC3_16270 [Deinococcus cellulosilyticus NBRC 106333 = KACC 11606]
MTHRPLIILDLDETLIHSTVSRSRVPNPDFLIDDLRVKIRPHTLDILKVCFDHFDVGVWTSSAWDYAEAVLKAVFPKKYSEQIKFLWSREHCIREFDEVLKEHLWAKHLGRIEQEVGYLQERVWLIDDSPEKFRGTPGKIIRVKPFFGDEDDIELLELAGYLGRLGMAPQPEQKYGRR